MVDSFPIWIVSIFATHCPCILRKFFLIKIPSFPMQPLVTLLVFKWRWLFYIHCIWPLSCSSQWFTGSLQNIYHTFKKFHTAWDLPRSYTNMAIKLTSFNIRGLNSPFKWLSLSREAHSLKSDVLLIQETHFAVSKKPPFSLKHFLHSCIYSQHPMPNRKMGFLHPQNQ